jgi:putative flavoprotein involved in K+ transport
MITNTTEVAIVGAGAAGITVAMTLHDRGADFEIFDDHRRVGDSWRERYRSLRLFTPRRLVALPGLQPDLGYFAYPTGFQFADYLEDYVEQRRVPVQLATRVDRLTRIADSGFRLELSTGRQVLARRVIVTAGAHRIPVTPGFATQLDPSIRQLHSLQYAGPEQLAAGPVLVVGAGNSGTDLALEAKANGHPVVLAGRQLGEVPFPVDSPVANLLAGMVIRRLRRLTIDTEKGRAAKAAQLGHGLMLIRNKERDLLRAGVVRVGRVEGVRDGKPIVDGQAFEAATVVWCTGSRPDVDWIDIDGVVAPDGHPIEHRGIADAEPRLGFVGLDFQYAAASSTLTGFAQDACYVVNRLLEPGMAAAERLAAEPLSHHVGLARGNRAPT